MSERVTSCDNCGACCMGQNLLPWSWWSWQACDHEYRLPVTLQKELDSIAASRRIGDDGCPCVWLDRATGECKHYPHRPPPCRELEVGGSGCLRWREQFPVITAT
jgi:Fe-S-cluster containining protein